MLKVNDNYGGFQYRKNVYRCEKCGGETVTVDRDAGVTPFMINCRATPGCDGESQSSFYRVPQDLTPKWEWYRPGALERLRLTVYVNDHVKQGGLLLRSVDDGRKATEAGSQP